MPYHWADYFLFDDSLAFAYYKTGDLEKARSEYERIISLLFGRINYPEVFAKTFYMLGQIYEQQGQKAKAIANYHKVLDLWKNADPGLAEVSIARKKLAAIKTKKAHSYGTAGSPLSLYFLCEYLPVP
jgi:tetratricopeptide (TPR) repeat protein